MPTAHNEAKIGNIAKTVLMPGDPLRAKFIAENFLDNPVCFNTIRNMLGYTGTYKGTRVSVMGSGMGMPSIGIYSYELFNEYGVDNIMRIGTCGALRDDIHVRDVVLAEGACTDSNFAAQYNLTGTFAPIADFKLLKTAYEISEKIGLKTVVGNVMSSDVFYCDDPNYNDNLKKMGVIGVEMEAAALYMNAARLGKRALCILTVSNHLYLDEDLTPKERQVSFIDMMKIALDTAVSMENN